MPDIKNFDIEKIFTPKNYVEFLKAIKSREDYEFIYAKQGTYLPHPATGIYFMINGRKCDNGIWKDNYLYGIDTWRGNGGVGMPFDPMDTILSYDEVINILYEGLYLVPPQQKQLNFFGFEM